VRGRNHSKERDPQAGYLAWLKHKRYSPQTIRTYGLALDKFRVWMNAQKCYRLTDITETHLEAYRLSMIERGFTEATQEVFMRAVKNLFGWMEKEGTLFLNPARGLVIRQAKPSLPVVIGEDEVKRLLAQPCVTTALGIRDRAILEIGYSCALRRNELASLGIFDPDLDRQTLRVMGKGSKERVLPLGKHATYWLGQYLRRVRPQLAETCIDESALWIGRRARPLSGQGIAVMLKGYGLAAGLKAHITPHVLRRSCVTHMLDHGAHPVQLQLMLGHSGMRHLSNYLRMSIRDVKAMHHASNPGK
jgi:integrase/recombinase XerD